LEAVEIYNNRVFDLIELQRKCLRRNSEEVIRNKNKYEKKVTMVSGKVKIENVQSVEIDTISTFE
jgi:hypothetical protein